MLSTVRIAVAADLAEEPNCQSQASPERHERNRRDDNVLSRVVPWVSAARTSLFRTVRRRRNFEVTGGAHAEPPLRRLLDLPAGRDVVDPDEHVRCQRQVTIRGGGGKTLRYPPARPRTRD